MGCKAPSLTGRKVQDTSGFSPSASRPREQRYVYEMDHWIGAERFDRLLPDFKLTLLVKVMQAGLPADIHPDKAVRASGLPVTAK